MEKNICRRLGVPEAPINKSRKRKANEDNHGQSEFQFSGGKQTRSPIHMAKKTKPTASSPGGKKHSYALRSGDGNDASEVVHPSDHATKGDTPALFEREKCFENEYHNTRSPPFDENIADEGMRTPNAAEDCLQPENSGTAVTALTGYSNVLLVRPQSYVSPPKSTLTRRYRDEEHTSADTESEWSLLDPVERSDDESDGKVDLKDYQKYLEKHHKSDSDSSEDSNMGP
ncbi:hypothetical protein Bca4012_076142 [Brassica carinata]